MTALVVALPASSAHAGNLACPDTAQAPSFYKSLGEENILFGYLAKENGDPARCADGPETKFDGEDYNLLELTWNNGLSFSLQSLPPETSITKIKLESGFPDKNALQQTIREHIDAVSDGIEFNWDEPGISKNEKGTTEEFIGEPSGMNAIVRFYKDLDNRLTEASVSFAP